MEKGHERPAAICSTSTSAPFQVVPFHLESRLRELGARFEGAGNWQAFAVTDSPFITGQNPQSSALVAQHLLAALGIDATALAVA